MTIRDMARKIPYLAPAVRWIRSQLRERVDAWRLAGRARDDVFGEIYRRNRWGSPQSASGTGSDLDQTALIARELPLLFRRHGVRSVLDIPCGDFHWMARVDLDGIDYTGADIVPDLIARNQAAHARDGVRFLVLDLSADRLPKSDLVFCRDCLVHLSFDDVHTALRNIVASGAEWLLTTTFPLHARNRDIRTGQWRVLNLEAAPFLLPTPLEMINEGCTEGDGEHRDKSLGLWSVAQLRDAFTAGRDQPV